MSDYAKRLGESIFINRKRMHMTQAELAEKAGVTEQTIRKIEHGDGNPQLDVLCPLVTALEIDPSEIVYPRLETADPARKRLEIILSDCSNNQIQDLLPVVEAALKIVKAHSLIVTK